MDTEKHSKTGITALIFDLIPLIPILFFWKTKYRFLDQPQLFRTAMVRLTPIFFFLAFLLAIVDIKKTDGRKTLSKIALLLSSVFLGIILFFAIYIKFVAGWW